MDGIAWAGIVLCLIQSGTFSGLNLALLGLSRMRLEAEAASGNSDAAKILRLRADSHLLLTTILWGNVAVNTLLALISESLLAGVTAFLFATFGITIFGEIIPQAVFSRHAIRVGALLAPVVRVYSGILYPIAKPSAMLLDWLLGDEEIAILKERSLREVIKLHALSPSTDLDVVEAIGALNFLSLDDLPVSAEGEPVSPASVVRLPRADESLAFPEWTRSPDDPFLSEIQASGKKWVILTDPQDRPRLVLDADGFLRAALFGREPVDPLSHCHEPIVVDDPGTPLGDLLRRLHVQPADGFDDVVDRDLILLWSAERRIVTGADLLGRLLRGIATRDVAPLPARA